MRIRRRVSTVSTALLGAASIVTLAFSLTLNQTVSATVPGVNTLVSQDSSGTYQNGTAYTGTEAGPFVSGDGRYVVFSSSATNLISTDANGALSDVFRRDTTTGTTTLISKNTSGVQGNAQSYAEGISYDGRYVIFRSRSTNLVSNYGTIYTLYRHDTVTGTTVTVNSTSSVTRTRAGSISADGRYVTYSSSIVGVATGDEQIYVKDMELNAIKMVSVDSSNSPGTGSMGTNEEDTSISSTMNCSGNIIAFTSDATNLPNNGTGSTTRKNLFIADVGWNGVKLTNVTQTPSNNTNTVRNPVVSCDGNTVVYAYGVSGAYTLRKYDRITNTNTAVSVKSTGSVIYSGDIAMASISGNGRFVAFTDTGSDIDSAYSSTGAGIEKDVYIRDTKNNTTQLVSFTTSGNRSGRVNTSSDISLSNDGSYVTYNYKTPESTNPGAALISGLTTGTTTYQYDIYKSETGF